MSGFNLGGYYVVGFDPAVSGEATPNNGTELALDSCAIRNRSFVDDTVRVGKGKTGCRKAIANTHNSESAVPPQPSAAHSVSASLRQQRILCAAEGSGHSLLQLPLP